MTTDDITIVVNRVTGSGEVTYTVSNGDEWSLSTAVTALGEGTVQDGVALQFRTDIESGSDDDYLVWGSWANSGDGGASTHEETTQGAFAAGSEPFTEGNLADGDRSVKEPWRTAGRPGYAADAA